MIEVRHLRTLAALREAGSLAGAAERLCVTESALSHQLAGLEDRLGARLFVRKSRPLRFTSAGTRLLQLADEVLPRLRRAEGELAKLSAGEAGRLHICIECHSCVQWLLPCLDRYRADWPAVELDLTTGFSFAPLPALARGDLDLVITADPAAGLDGIAYLPLFTYEAVLAVGKGHRLAGAQAAQPADLAAERLIAYPVERDRLDLFTRFLDPAGVEPESVRTAELTAMIVQLVASGRGVACLPNWALAEYLERGVVQAVPLGEGGVWVELFAAVREDQQEAAYVREFVRTAVEACFGTLEGIRGG